MDITQYASAFPSLSDEDFIAAGFSPDEVYAYRVNQQAASETSQAYDLATIQEARRRRGEALAAQYPDYFTQGLEVEPSYGIDQRIADISAGAQLTQDPNFARRQFARLSTDLGLPLSLTESVLGLAELTPYGSFASGYDAASAIPQTAEYIRSGEYGKAALTAAGGGLAALDAAALALPISVPVARAVSNVDTGKLAADVVGTGRALADMDLEFLRGRGNPAMSQPAGAEVTGRPPLTFDDVESAMRAAPKGAAVKPQMGEAFDDWIDRIYSPENRGPQNVVQDENVVFRAMSPKEAEVGEEAGVFRDLSGQPLYVANDPERYIGGGAYGGKRQGRIYEFDVTGLASEVRQGGVGIQERAISEIPTDRVRRVWEWNPDTKAHELIVDNTQMGSSETFAPTGVPASPRAPVTFDDVERAMQEAPLAEIPRITPSDLRDARIIPTVADLTAAGRDYKGIDASKLDVPEPLMGGPGYPLLPSSQQAGLAWAVDAKSIGTKKTGKGADLIAISAMNPDSHRSNTSVVNSILKTTEAYVRDGRIQPTVLDELDAAVRQAAAGGDPALAKLELFPGFRSPNIDEFIRGSSFEARKRIADIIGNKTFQGKGVPNVNRILQETVEKQYAGANPRDVLFFIEPDFSAPPVDLAEAGLPIHPSYRYGIRGRVFGALDQNISTFEMFPTFWGEKNIKAFGLEFNNGGRRAFDLTLPIEEVTGKQVEDLERLLTYEAAKQVDLSAIDTRILVNSMTDKWKPTTTPVTQGGASPQAFVDAIQNNKYRPALTNYTPQEVKAGARSGDLVAYQLGDDDVFFAIDNKPDYSWAGVEMQPEDKALVGVVSNAPGSRGTAAPSVIAKALDEGATILDAFAVPSKRFPDGYLPEYYGEFGFDEVGRVPFDKEMYIADHGEQAFEDLLDAWRSDGWDESMGMPPVIVMRWSGTDADRAATAAGIRGAGSPSYRAESGGTYFEARGSAGRVPDETVQQGAPGDGRGASGAAGDDNRANLSRRAREGAESLLGLTPQQLRNKGIPEDQIQQLMELRNIGQ